MITRSHPLDDVFDVEAREVQTTTTSLPVPIDTQETKSIDDDADLASKNLKILIELGQSAAVRASEVAEDSESPRAYEVLSNLLKTMSDMNIQLLDVHEKKRKIKSQSGETQSQPGVTNNTAVFVGTTAGLMEMLEQHRKGKEQ